MNCNDWLLCNKYWIFSLITKLYNIFRRLRIGWNFLTGAVIMDFDLLKVNIKTLSTQIARPDTKPRLLSHHT